LRRPGHPRSDGGQGARAASPRAVQGQGREVRRGSDQEEGRQGRSHRWWQRSRLGRGTETDMARKTKLETRKKRHFSLRKRMVGTAERPRLVVFRSARHIYVQVIDDLSRKTVVAASDLLPKKADKKAAAGEIPTEGKKAERAKRVGTLVAKR